MRAPGAAVYAGVVANRRVCLLHCYRSLARHKPAA